MPEAQDAKTRPKKAKSAAASRPSYGDKIVDDVRRVPITALRPNEWNPNVMDAETEASLELGLQQEGFVTPILVQKATNRIIDGEHRWTVAKRLGFSEVLAQFHDCDDVTAKKLTLAFNNRRGHHQADKLDDLLTDLRRSSGADLNPLELGYSKEYLDRILAASSSFLDEFADDKSNGGNDLDAGDTDLEDDGPAPLPGSSFVRLNYLATNEQKKAIVGAIVKAKAELGTAQSGEALAHICQQFLDREVS